MPPKRKANATKKGDASESTARRPSPDPPADSASAQSPEHQPGAADTVSEKPASGAGAATNNEDAAVGTAGVPDHSQVMKRKPGRVAKRGRAAANAPKDPAEQTPEIPNRSEPAGADVDGPTVTTEPPVKTAGKRGLAALGPPAKRAAAAANASEPGQEFASPNHSNTSDGDATDGPTVAAEQRPAKAGKRGRAAARKVAEPHALSAHGQGAAVDAVSPVRSPSTHSEPPAAPAEDGKRAGTSKSTGKQAAKRGHPAKSIAATAVPQQQVHDNMSAEPQSQALATHDQHADEAKTEGERTSGSPVRSLPIHSKTAGGLEAGQSAGTSKSTAGKRGRPAKSKAATAAQQQQVHDDLAAEPQLEQRASEGQHAEVNVGKAKGGRNSGGPVGSPSPHSNPTSVHAEAGGSTGASKSTGRQAAKRGRPAKSKAATAGLQQQVHDDPPAEQQLAMEDQHAEVAVGKAKGGKNSESLVRSPSPHSKSANAHADAGGSAGTSKSTGKQAAKRGRPAKGKPTTAALQQQDHHELPADASNPGEDSGSQNPLLPKKRSLGLSKQPVLMANGNTDVSDVAAKNSLAKGTKRGRASGTIEAAASESRELGEQGPPAKRATVSASSFYGTTPGTTAQGAKRAGRPAKQPPPAAVPSTSSPGTAAATDGHSGRVAKKASTKAQPAAAKGPGKQNKKQPAKGETAASNGTGKQKKVAKGRQQPKSKQGKRKDADDLSDVSDSSYVVPRGLLQRAKRREPFYYDYIVPWVESQLPSESDDEDDFSTASLSSIIPPAGVLQPYRPKNRLIGAGGSGSSSEDDMSVSPGEDLLSRCEAKFGVGTLPHSTTTTAEAISMLVNFVSSRHLPFRDLAELVTIANKLFAPAEDVLPTGKALAKALSEMP